MTFFKKIILAIALFVIYFGVISPSTINAQSPPASTLPGGAPIPGITCGNAESTDPAVRKCCISPKLTITDRLSPPEDLCLINIAGAQGLCVGKAVQNLFDWVINSSPTIKKINDEWLPTAAKQYNPCISGNPSTNTSGDTSAANADPNCVCVIEPPSTKFLCDRYMKNSNDYSSCVSCADKGVWTSFGCIDNNLSAFIQNTVFGMGIGLAGGFALLCIIFAAFQMQSSQGNPEKIKKAQEMLTSCIMGLMLIIFSVFILRLIGVSILKIPGF